jgi:hypothetical protein
MIYLIADACLEDVEPRRRHPSFKRMGAEGAEHNPESGEECACCQEESHHFIQVG